MVFTKEQLEYLNAMIDSRMKGLKHENRDHLDRALLAQKLKPGKSGTIIASDGQDSAWKYPNEAGVAASDWVEAALSEKSDEGHNHDDRYPTSSEFSSFATLTEDWVETALSEKSDEGHHHDDRYPLTKPVAQSAYTIGLITQALLEVALSEKSDEGHNHDGRHFSRVYVGSFANPGSTGNASYTGVGFKPKVVLFCCMPADSTTTSGLHIGAMDSFGRQFYAAFRAATTGAAMANESNTTACVMTLNTAGTTARKASYVSMDTDGFTLNWSTASAAGNTYYVALG